MLKGLGPFVTRASSFGCVVTGTHKNTCFLPSLKPGSWRAAVLATSAMAAGCGWDGTVDGSQTRRAAITRAFKKFEIRIHIEFYVAPDWPLVTPTAGCTTTHCIFGAACLFQQFQRQFSVTLTASVTASGQQLSASLTAQCPTSHQPSRFLTPHPDIMPASYYSIEHAKYSPTVYSTLLARSP